MNIGWIGLGRVGEQMALSALAGGHTVTGHSRRFAHHMQVERAGGQLRSSVIETVRDAELVCVNVFSEDQLTDALLDNGGLASMRPGTILAVHSTVPPSLILRLGSLRPDLDVLDAGFSGSADDAANGQLTLIVGGRAAAVARAEPVFRCYADTIARVGPSGAGMTLKIINNLLFAAHMTLAREALGVAMAHGITMHDALAVLQRGSAASFALGNYQRGTDPDAIFDQVRPYMEKDVAIGLSAFELIELASATRTFVLPTGPT